MTKAREDRQDNLFLTRLPAPEVCGGEVTDHMSVFTITPLFPPYFPQDKLESCSNTLRASLLLHAITRQRAEIYIFCISFHGA